MSRNLLIFGPPTQISTIIGLATAGLTVVLKDFIVAFFGWFVLMGRHGLRIGDWVEILGVSGEVIEIGLLRTVILEMGNWGDTGHPTGRRVGFNNSFARSKCNECCNQCWRRPYLCCRKLPWDTRGILCR